LFNTSRGVGFGRKQINRRQPKRMGALRLSALVLVANVVFRHLGEGRRRNGSHSSCFTHPAVLDSAGSKSTAASRSVWLGWGLWARIFSTLSRPHLLDLPLESHKPEHAAVGRLSHRNELLGKLCILVDVREHLVEPGVEDVSCGDCLTRTHRSAR